MLKAVFQLNAAEFSRCFAPPTLCARPAIRAHSVQNATCLDLLADNGHVIGLSRRMSAAAPPEISFARIGRHRATTFAGLCADHDRRIFAPIETAAFDTANPEHLFLAAYRATFREVHASCAAGWMLQMGYQKRVELGLDAGNVPSDAGLLATRQLIMAHQTFVYKLAFDEAYLARDFVAIQHDTFEIGTPRPLLAACCLFSIDDAVTADDVVRVCLNVLPLSARRTVIILSYTRGDAAAARGSLDRILSATGPHRLYELSKRLLNSCENFVVAPAHLDTWPEAKRDTIRAYFLRTLLKDALDYEHEALYLF